MESKKSFGEYIRIKRIECGFTQKIFADKLYVSESAISKWERGVSYPDITLIGEICKLLDVSESELLNACEDKQARRNETLALKYISLIKRVKIFQYIIYAIPLIVCFICNLAINHTLSWFFIVMGAELVAASVTLLPMFYHDKKLVKTLMSFYGTIAILVLICVIYSRGNWYFIFSSALLMLSSLTIVPLYTKKYRGLKTIGCYLGSLVLLLITCSIYSKGDWLFVASISVIFGFSIVFSPYFLISLPLPAIYKKHKALIYFAVNTTLLFIVLLVSDLYLNLSLDFFITKSVPIALFNLLMPWALFVCIRYIKVNEFFKAAICTGVICLYIYLIQPVIDRMLGETYTFVYEIDFTNWDEYTSNNIRAIVLMTLLGLTFLFTVLGVCLEWSKSRKNNS